MSKWKIKSILTLSLFRSTYARISSCHRHLTNSINMSTFVQKVNVVTGVAEWAQESENYDYHQEVARSAYADMLHDHDRNMKYYKGLELAIKELHRRGQKAVVLDIGTGTGLLSMMAAKLGADVIYACEAFAPMAKCAANVIKHNGFTDRIKLIPKRSTELEVGEGKDLETRANVLVTEVFDTELIGEGGIGTYNHAHEFLLAEGSFLIPTKAVYYAQVVHCHLVPDWNKINPINLPTGVQITFPEDIAQCPGISSVHDVQLSEIKENQFTRLSDPLPIFEFDWAQHSNRLPITDASTLPFSAQASEPCTAIFTWWDLQMSSLAPENLPSNTITMKPSWAGEGSSAWRDHWMQSIYYNPSPIQLSQGVKYFLQSFHDEYSFWYKVHAKEESRTDMSSVERPTCTCGVHVAMSRSRLGHFNDLQLREKYVKILEPLVKEEGACLVLSEGSVLPFLLAGLGVKKVYVQESNGWSKRAMAKLVVHAGMEKQIILIDNIRDETVAGMDEIGAVIGEPFSHDAVLPWHNLNFWYSFQRIKSHLPSSVKLFPGKAILKGVIVSYQDLWKIRSTVGKVCNGDFDIVDFDQLIHNSSEVSDSMIDAQPLWEYPSTTCSNAFTLLTFDFTKSIEPLNSEQIVTTTGNPNGVSLWMEWHHGDDKHHVISTGPSIDSSLILPGLQLQWDRNWKQGVYFFKNNSGGPTINSVGVECKASFSARDGTIKFSFTET